MIRRANSLSTLFQVDRTPRSAKSLTRTPLVPAGVFTARRVFP